MSDMPNTVPRFRNSVSMMSGQFRGAPGRTVRHLPRALLAGVALLALGACSVRPEPVPPETTLQYALEAREKLFQDQEPVSAPVTLYEAIARGLKYNLDSRLALMEQVLQDRQLDLTRMDMLPRLAANAGYTTRNNVNASSSRSILSGQQSLEPSTSQEIPAVAADLSFSWNLLDFGLSYYQARQQANRVMIQMERRRRVVNNVVQEIKGAFWQAATGERLLARINPVIAEAEEALAQSRAIEAAQLGTPAESLEFQKSLLEVLRQLRALRSDVATAKARLASLMNIPPGQEYSLVMPQDTKPPTMPADLKRLELLALFNRPELREENYQRRIGEDEVRKAKLRFFPSLNLTSSLNYDANEFLWNNFWAEAGVNMSYNLVGLLSNFSARDVAKAQVQLAETRQLALSMAVITQVNIAHTQYRQALEQYEQAVEMSEIERRLFEMAQNAEIMNAQGTLDRIRRAALTIGADLQRDRSLAAVQTSFGNIYAALGVDPLPDAVEDHSIPTLATAIGAVHERWRQGDLPPLPWSDKLVAPALSDAAPGTREPDVHPDGGMM